MMPGTDALVFRTQITEQFDSTLFRRYVDENARVDVEQTGNAFFGSNFMFRALQLAETYYVSPNMLLVVQAAARSFPEDEVILKEDMPSEAGIMYFPQVIRMIELRGQLMSVRGVLWCNERLWMLADTRDPDDGIWAGLPEKPPFRYDLAGCLYYRFGHPIPKQLVAGDGVLSPDAKVTIKQDEHNTVLWTDHHIDVDDIHAIPAPMLRIVLATWRLMQQTLASVDREDKHLKSAMRYAMRAKVPPAVTVISLRRHESSHTGTGTPLTYRLLVRGHWRRVLCGPRDDPSKQYKRAVWIHPHIKGPEDAPLHISQKVYSLER